MFADVAISAPRRSAPAPSSPASRDADTGAAVAVVRAAESFDQTTFALAAFLVFPALVVPYWGELLGLLFGATLFALGFALRPVGRWAAQLLRGGLGVPRVLLVAGVVLALCTAATGTLPGYGVAGGLSILLLLACRTGQGLAWGACGSLHPAPASASAVVGALAGAVAAAGLMALIASQLVHADFVAWGWRYPFCAALAIHLVALFARMRLACGAGELRDY
jgi:MFS family permease